VWGIKHESHHAQLFCKSAGSILASENLHVVVCRYRCIITDKVSSHLTVRCRLNLSRVFRYQFYQRTTNEGIGIENTCPAQSDKSSQSRIFRSGHPRVRVRFRMPPPESLMSSGDSCAENGAGFRVLVEFLVPACRRMKLPSRI